MVRRRQKKSQSSPEQKEYRKAKQVEGLQATSIYEAMLTLPGLKFHDLRKTFASLLAQRGVSTAVTQRLLEHSSPQLTNDVYTNIDPVLRQAIDRLPVADWIEHRPAVL
jgi:integrase